MLNWKRQTKNLLKKHLTVNSITHEMLAELLGQIGVEETKASIDNKLSRGSFSASFLMQCFAVINSSKTGEFDENHLYDYILRTLEPTEAYQYGLFQPNTAKKRFKNIKSETSYLKIEQDEQFCSTFPRKCISLFSGAGGFDIGIEEAGFETVACVEIDADCRETLNHNRPKWKLFDDNQGRIAGDIRSISPKDILKLASLSKGETGLVIGGAPCQPFSNIGKKQGVKDEKNGDLFLEFVKIVKGVSPQSFIFENVAGITQAKHKHVINYMKEQFAGLGYGISCSVLNAADYGVAQTRKRFFLIGIKDVENPAFPLPTHCISLSGWEKFASKLDFKPDFIPKQWLTIADRFSLLNDDISCRPDYAVMNISQKVLDRMKYIGPGENFKVLPMDMRPNCWKNGKHQGQDTFGRLKINHPSVTLRTAAYNPSKGRYIHPTEDRGLNTIEMATIQGFPSDWCFRCKGRTQITLVSAGRQIGNAVPPPLAKSLGEAIKRQLRERN